MSEQPHVSHHRTPKGKIVKVPRTFAQAHLDALYHLTEFSMHSSADHDLVGTHQGRDGLVTVNHLVEGPTGGPEFEVVVENGPTITTLHEDGVLFHLAQFGVAREERNEA